MGDLNDTQKVIDRLVDRTIEMTSQWEKEQFGSFASWFKIFNAVLGFIAELKDQVNQVDKIKIGLDVVEQFARGYVAQYKDQLDKKGQETLEIFVSGNGADILESSNNFVQDLLDKIDTNNDGEISGLECKNYCRKLFCCAPITIEELEEGTQTEVIVEKGAETVVEEKVDESKQE
jgi:hypothetical protein